MSTSSALLQAKEIVLKDLRACYRRAGILAAKKNYSDFWARDSFWAIMGMLSTKYKNKREAQRELDKVRNTIELFFEYQNKKGKIPRKISLDYTSIKYAFKKSLKRKKPKPVYYSSIKGLYSFDDNLLLVIAFCKYVRRTRDYNFARKYYNQVARLLTFYNKEKLIKGVLLYEIGLSNWADTILKKGFVLYTNCLWFRAIKGFEKLSDKLGICPNINVPESRKIRNAIRNVFWIRWRGYFADTVSVKGEKSRYFDLAGNLLALLFNVAEPSFAGDIITYADQLKKQGEFFHATNSPLYPFWRVRPICHIIGITKYHNGCSWSWLEALFIAMKFKYGYLDSGERDLNLFSEIILRDKHIYEVYNLDGRPFNKPLWKSAVPFAWGAGMFLYAFSFYERKGLGTR